MHATGIATFTTNVEICNRYRQGGAGDDGPGVRIVKQYVIYKRLSTEDQGKSGLGLAAQERDIQLFLTGFTEVPYEVLADYIEIETGKVDDRPMLAEALSQVRKTGADLLVAKLDRLSRRLSFFASVMDDPKVRFRVAQMPYSDKFQLHIYAALAEQEREFISARTKAALAEAKARGARADRVAGIILPLREAGKPLREIAEHLNRAGDPTARGGQWQASQVMRTLDRLSTHSAQAGA